ncbi:MAG: hypothetical protein V8Q42_03925 [Anaerovoracaceae bacterium]
MKNMIEIPLMHETDPLVRELFERMSDAVFRMLVQGAEKTGINRILMAGGTEPAVLSELIQNAGRICRVLKFF